MKKLEEAYSNISNLSSQREFAIEAMKTRCPAALFSVRAGKASSVKDFIKNMNTSALEKLF